MKNVKKLLSNGMSNAKTKKNVRRSWILYMSPYTDNSKGINVCPHASKGCAESCLNTAGRGKMNVVQEARRRKTEFWIDDKKEFYRQLAKEIQGKINWWSNKNAELAFRLNGTSDLDHMKMLKSFGNFDYKDTPENVVFYDYTKVPNFALKYRDCDRYHLTFSRSEENHLTTLSLLSEGVNAAVVFRNELPETWNGFRVIDGDKTDDRTTDPTDKDSGYVIGLRAKGEAKKDTSGFVVDC